ncbi:DUF3750 domain-containing protein [Sneathiella sp. HT1-7]|uniref:DUF3750 domain-containing protein n=1 Tax=Sneathiella sp. HT1-7 TaxID=2887192 RepID=UPI001D15412E|nr:DUF3750 domain-containing protein [Sneathiella sp. HT1-7]MCC3305970.1 DUF3750 domain-containing protein [Sneathiella sp. HT1-7]
MAAVRKVFLVILCAILLFGLPQMLSVAAGTSSEASSWSSARRDATGLSPSPETHKEAIIQIFGARTWGWRGNFAIHTWISMKRKDADNYDRYEVIGWRARNGGNALVHSRSAPDNHWFGNTPEVLAVVEGPEAEKLIDRIEASIESYPHKYEYRVWPGPNSNSFIAHIGREVPELELDLPPTAIGKDFISGSHLLGNAVSGRGMQFSLLGLGGFTLSPVEGVEVHLLGLTLGLDIDDFALKIPGFGRLEPFSEQNELP